MSTLEGLVEYDYAVFPVKYPYNRSLLSILKFRGHSLSAVRGNQTYSRCRVRTVSPSVAEIVQKSGEKAEKKYQAVNGNYQARSHDRITGKGSEYCIAEDRRLHWRYIQPLSVQYSLPILNIPFSSYS